MTPWQKLHRSSAHAHGRHDCQVTRSSHGRRGPPTSKSHYSWSCHPPTGIAGELIQRLASKLLNFQFCNMLNDANPFFLQGHQRVCPVCGQHIAAYIYIIHNIKIFCYKSWFLLRTKDYRGSKKKSNTSAPSTSPGTTACFSHTILFESAQRIKIFHFVIPCDDI